MLMTDTLDHAAEQSDQELLENLIVDNPDLERLEEVLNQFNIFEAVGAVRQELRHSDFLGFLLDPQQPHGLGDLFFRKLLQKVLLSSRSVQMPVSLVDLDVWSLDETLVYREWHSVDIFLVNEDLRLAVIIENKIAGGEHSGQLQRYLTTVEQHCEGYKVIPLFLTPDGDLPLDDRYLPVSYELVAGLVESIVEARGSTLGAEVRTMMSHYTEMLRRYIVSGSEIDELCTRIYRKHQRAIDLIIERRPDRQSQMREFLAKLIAETGGVAQDRVSKSEIGFVPEVWDDRIPKGPPDWSPAGRVLLFYFENQPGRLRLVLIIGPGPEAVRRRLFEIAQANRDLLKPPKTLHKKWDGILTLPVLAASDYSNLEDEGLEAKTRRFWKKFIAEDMPAIVERICAGMAAPQA